MITAIATSVATALCIAAIFAVCKSRWLYVIAPKLYLTTTISDGQIVSLTIFNAGFLSEEDVAISFRPACKFELLGTSKSTLLVSGNTLSIAKLSRFESVSVMVLVEGKGFDPADIESIESKATRGKVVESKEKATPIWQTMVIVPVVLLALAVPFVFGTVVGADTRVSAFGYVSDQLELLGASKQLAGFELNLNEKYGQGKLQGAVKNSKIVIRLDEVVRRGDVLTLSFEIANNTPTSLMIEGRLKSSAGDRGPVSFWESRTEPFALAVSEKKTIKLKVFMPESLTVQIVEGDFSFRSPPGDSVDVHQTIVFK